VQLLGTSRDGSRVVLGTEGRLISVRGDGTGFIYITPSSLNVILNSHFGTTVSHFGGSRAVFVGCVSPCGWSNLGQPGNIFVVNADGTGLTQLTTDGDGVAVVYQGARISADGRRIIFVRTEFGSQTTLYVINSDGTNQQPLSLPQVGVVTCPSRIRCQAATGSWTRSLQWETQRTWFKSAGATVFPSPNVSGVWPSKEA
jgi:hypothetical protein